MYYSEIPVNKYEVYKSRLIRDYPSLDALIADKDKEKRRGLGIILILMIEEDWEGTYDAVSQTYDKELPRGDQDSILLITEESPNSDVLRKGLKNIADSARKVKAFDAANIIDGLLATQWKKKGFNPYILLAVAVGGFLVLKK
tara:strand:- start:1883 stop:2311 length:429 start_codon:yes stop_codon:yes gene_type:complete